MTNEEKIGKLQEDECQEIFGVKKATFDAMLEILEWNYLERHKEGGRPPKLRVLDKLIIMLQYYREYRAMQHIAFDYGVSKSTICDSIAWVEQTLSKSGRFRLPSKQELTKPDCKLEVVIADATECEIERPEKNRKVLFREKEEAYIQAANHSRRTNQGHNLHCGISRKEA